MLVSDLDAPSPQFLDGPLHVDGVTQRDCGAQDVQATSVVA